MSATSSILYVFIILLALLTLLSAFGGSIRPKETFIDDAKVDLPENFSMSDIAETFIASPPFQSSMMQNQQMQPMVPMQQPMMSMQHTLTPTMAPVLMTPQQPSYVQLQQPSYVQPQQQFVQTPQMVPQGLGLPTYKSPSGAPLTQPSMVQSQSLLMSPGAASMTSSQSPYFPSTTYPLKEHYYEENIEHEDYTNEEEHEDYTNEEEHENYANDDDEQKIEMFVDPYDKSEKHATL